MLISSLNNPTIKRLRALRQRKEREQSGQFFIEGIRLVAEALQLGVVPELLVIAPELLTSSFAREMVAEQQQAGVRCLEVTPAVFQRLSTKDGPQGLGAVLWQRWEPLRGVRLAADACWVALTEIQDPGNLGTILRTCDAVGCGGVVLLGATTDPYDPAALRGSMGAVFGQRLVRATFAEFVTWQQQHSYFLVGAAGDAATDYRAVQYRRPVMLLMGSEREGLTAEQQAACDQLVSIAMVGRSDSLNLAVATGVVLYELFYQQRVESQRRA